jgi:hypothetical protein
MEAGSKIQANLAALAARVSDSSFFHERGRDSCANYPGKSQE